MRPWAALTIGLLLGGIAGLAYFAAPVSVFLAFPVWAWLLRRPGRLPALAGGLMGFGLAEEFLVGRYAVVCATYPTCVGPNVTWAWVGIGLVFFAAGALVALAARGQLLEG